MAKTRGDFITVIEKNDYQAVSDFIKQNKNWAALCAEQKESKSSLHYAGWKKYFNSVHAILDAMVKENIKDNQDQYQAGVLLIEIARNEVNCSISKAALAKKVIQVNPIFGWHLEEKKALHLCCDHCSQDQELIETLCEVEPILTQQYKNQVPIVYAANNDKWEMVVWISKKNPKHFAQYAKEIWNTNFAKKQSAALQQLFSDPATFKLIMPHVSYDALTSVEATKYLFNAVAADCVDAYQKLLTIVDKSLRFSSVYALTSTEYENMTLLELACKSGSWKCVEAIVTACKIKTNKAGYINDMSNWHASQALLWAVKNDNYYYVNMFLEYGFPFSGNGDGSAEIMAAVKNGNNAIVQLLLEKKASANVNDDETPLVIAIKNLIEQRTKRLAEKKEEASSKEKAYERIIYQILEHNPLINSRDNKESRAMILAVQGNLIDLAKRLYSQKGALATTKNENDNLLFLAAQNENKEMVLFLNSSKAPMNIIKEGENPKCPALLAAIDKNSFDITKMLLSNSDSPAINDHDNENGNKALQRACHHDNDEILKLLLAHGADPDIRNGQSQTMEMYAKEKEKTKCYAALQEWRKKRCEQQIAILADLQNVGKVKLQKTISSGVFTRTTQNVDFEPDCFQTIKTQNANLKKDNPEMVAKALQTVRKSINDDREKNKNEYDANTLELLQKLSTYIDDTEAKNKKSTPIHSNSSSSSSTTSSFRNVSDILETVRPKPSPVSSSSSSSSSSTSTTTNSNSPNSTSFMNTIMNAFRSDSPSAPEQSVVQYNPIQQQPIPAVQQDVYCVDQSGQYYMYRGQDLSGNSIWVPVYFSPAPAQQPDQPPAYDSIATQPGYKPHS